MIPENFSNGLLQKLHTLTLRGDPYEACMTSLRSAMDKRLGDKTTSRRGRYNSATFILPSDVDYAIKSLDESSKTVLTAGDAIPYQDTQQAAGPNDGRQKKISGLTIAEEESAPMMPHVYEEQDGASENKSFDDRSASALVQIGQIDESRSPLKALMETNGRKRRTSPPCADLISRPRKLAPTNALRW